MNFYDNIPNFNGPIQPINNPMINNDINYKNMDLRTKCSNSALEFFKDETISREEKDKLFKDLTKLYFDSLK